MEIVYAHTIRFGFVAGVTSNCRGKCLVWQLKKWTFRRRLLLFRHALSPEFLTDIADEN